MKRGIRVSPQGGFAWPRNRNWPAGTPSVAIIGAGFAGVAVGVALVKAGIPTFTIFEQSPHAGGAWWDNSYPGAEVDTNSHIYSFGFKPYNWTRTHASRDELLGYLDETIDQYGLRGRLRLSCGVTEARWDERTHRYHVSTSTGETRTFDIVISAVGFLNVPKYPTWPGLADFVGPAFHTARWEHQHDLTGKRVAVVGSGSSASQVVPAIAPISAEVFQFQREPGWVRPKRDRNYTPAERAALTPLIQRYRRIVLFWQYEWPMLGAKWIRPGTKAHARMEQLCRDHIAEQLAGRPDLQDLVTPRYPFFGKRPLASDNHYPALLRENVHLIPKAVASVTAKGVVDADGEEYPVDAIVMATGFQAANYLATFEVYGRNGTSLHEFWAGDPAAFIGLTVPGFPNFFMLYGPNTNGGAIVSNLHRQAEYAVGAIRAMQRTGATSIDVRLWPYRLYNRWLERRIAGTAWTYSNNYYKSPSGRVVTNFPDSAIVYAVLTKVFRASLVSRLSRAPRPDLRSDGRDAARPVSAQDGDAAG